MNNIKQIASKCFYVGILLNQRSYKEQGDENKSPCQNGRVAIIINCYSLIHRRNKNLKATWAIQPTAPKNGQHVEKENSNLDIHVIAAAHYLAKKYRLAGNVVDWRFQREKEKGN